MDPRLTELMQKLNVIMRKVDVTLSTIDASVSQDQLGKLDDLITQNTEIDAVLDNILTKNTEIDAVLDNILTKNTEIDTVLDTINGKIAGTKYTEYFEEASSPAKDFSFFDDNEIIISGGGRIVGIGFFDDQVADIDEVKLYLRDYGAGGYLKLFEGKTVTDYFEIIGAYTMILKPAYTPLLFTGRITRLTLCHASNTPAAEQAFIVVEHG
jgi:hypothetical protein